MAKQSTKFYIDPGLEAFALNFLKTIDGAILEGVSCIGSNDIRVWYKILVDAKKEEYSWQCKLLPFTK